MSAKQKVLTRAPSAQCIKGGRPEYQIWVKRLSFAGVKLGSGSTERFAWEDAERRTRCVCKGNRDLWGLCDACLAAGRR
jgi:hypothetical protein